MAFPRERLRECMRNAVHSYQLDNPNEILTKQKMYFIVCNDPNMWNTWKGYMEQRLGTVLGFLLILNLTFLDSTYVDGFKQRLNDDLKQDREDDR